ncbi:MAG: hypothetical protein NZ902_06635 [Acidilobaceae archaeon]|nr:hypothetical protein [Acidilobaceae archaeon]
MEMEDRALKMASEAGYAWTVFSTLSRMLITLLNNLQENGSYVGSPSSTLIACGMVCACVLFLTDHPKDSLEDETTISEVLDLVRKGYSMGVKVLPLWLGGETEKEESGESSLAEPESESTTEG